MACPWTEGALPGARAGPGPTWCTSLTEGLLLSRSRSPQGAHDAQIKEALPLQWGGRGKKKKKTKPKGFVMENSSGLMSAGGVSQALFARLPSAGWVGGMLVMRRGASILWSTVGASRRGD